MLKPARPNRCTVASCSEPLGMPSLRVRAIVLLTFALGGAARRDLSEEAGSLAGVADVAVPEPRHLQQHRVLVAIDQQVGHLQAVSRGLPLRPELVARP